MTREKLLDSCEIVIRTQAKVLCRRYKLNYSDYISDLEQEGRLAVLKLIKKNTYDSNKGAFYAYAKPFIHGAMRRYIEKNMGNLSLSKNEMDTILNAKLMNFDGYSDNGICETLNITPEELSRHLNYDLKPLYINDLTETEEDDPYDLEIMALFRQLNLEELYKAWRAKVKEESCGNTDVLQDFLTQNFAFQAK